MVDTGFIEATDRIVVSGRPTQISEYQVKTVANMYPGRLVTRDTNDNGMKVATAMLAPNGWLGHEDTPVMYRPATKDTIYVVNDRAAMIRGGDFAILGSLAKGCNVTKGDLLANWAAGQVVGPVAKMAEGLALGIPFVFNDNVETTTYIELPADMAVINAFIDVTTVDADETIDVGLLSSEGGGDANGFIAAASLATAGKVFPNVAITMGSNEKYFSSCTIGALLTDTFTAGSDLATDVGTFARKPHVCDGTAKTVTYTCSAGSDTAAGWIWLVLASEGLMIAGQAEVSVNALAAAADLIIRSKI